MKKNILLALVALTASTSAFAHPGHGLETGFATGFMHPLTGWDHLLVMLSLGIWAARRPAAQGWQLPVVFVGVMAVSALSVMLWLPLSLAEWMVAASVLVMGGLLSANIKLARSVQVAIVTLAAAAHGYLHGIELDNRYSALFGMVLATACLHAIGWMVGRQQQPWLQKTIQLLGGLMVGLGAYWLLA